MPLQKSHILGSDCFPGSDDAPSWEMCDFCMDMGSCFYPMTCKKHQCSQLRISLHPYSAWIVPRSWDSTYAKSYKPAMADPALIVVGFVRHFKKSCNKDPHMFLYKKVNIDTLENDNNYCDLDDGNARWRPVFDSKAKMRDLLMELICQKNDNLTVPSTWSKEATEAIASYVVGLVPGRPMSLSIKFNSKIFTHMRCM